MNRYVARLLALLMVPVFAFAATTSAEAVQWGSTTAQWSVQGSNDDQTGIDDSQGLGGWTMKCNGSATYSSSNVSDLNIAGRVVCDVVVHQWNDPGPGELTDNMITMDYRGRNSRTEAECGILATSRNDILVTSAYAGFQAADPDCLIQEVCVTVYANDPGVFARHDFYRLDDKCVNVNLGEPPTSPENQCPYGNVKVANMQPVSGTNSYAGYFGKKVTISLELVPPGNQYHVANTPYRGWGYDAREFTGSMPKTVTWKGGSTDVANGSKWESPNDWASSDIGPGNLSSVGGEPKGIWIWIRKFDQAAGQSPGNGLYSDPQTPIQPLALAHKDYAGKGPLNGWGVNDPKNCHFYIGPKFWDDPNSTLDEPFGTPAVPIETNPGTEEPPEEELEPEPPLPEPGRCEFSFLEPSTWLTGGICELVKAMSTLINAVVGLPGKIWTAFKDGLFDLFVPADGYLDGKIEEFQAALAGSTIGNYIDVFEGLTPSGGSGCQGPSFRLNPFGSGGAASYPMSACDGAMATLAGSARLIIGISVTMGAAFASVRILGRSLGWNPGIGGDQ